MNTTYDYKRFAILYVDDEAQTAANFKEYFGDIFDVQVATSGEAGWELFKKNPDQFAIVMTDQRMPNSTGVELLEKVRTTRPRVLRILATAYSDLDAAIKAVNTGAIYKYITKPWDPPTLEMTLKRGMEFFLVQRERDLLMNEKMFAVQRLMMTDRLISLGIFAAGLSHHLRNSLTAVKTFIDLAPVKLQSEQLDVTHLRNPDYWRDFYQTVQGQITKVVSLLQNMQEIPEPPTLPLNDSIQINDLITGALQDKKSALAGKCIQVTTTLGQIPVIKGNRLMLKQAFELLLQDEALNVNQAGRISITTKTATNTQGVAGIHISLSDNGPEIPVSSLHCIFDPFFVRRNLPEEYGLNLLTFFFLIYHHGGEIVVKSSEAGGALFEIFVPADPGEISARHDDGEFLQRVFATEKVWEKMLLEP